MKQNETIPTNARFATIRAMSDGILKAYFDPLPTPETFRSMFDGAKIPRIKSNPLARRGGGPVYYSVAAIEKFLKSRALPGKLMQEAA